MSNCENIYRSTTPKIYLRIKDPDFDLNTISVCHIAIENDSGRNKKIFDNPMIDTEERTICLELTQEDTRSFEAGFINIQLKIKTNDGVVMASKIIRTPIHNILEEDVL